MYFKHSVWRSPWDSPKGRACTFLIIVKHFLKCRVRLKKIPRLILCRGGTTKVSRDGRASYQFGSSGVCMEKVLSSPFLCSSPIAHPFSMLAKCHLSRECKKVIKKAEVCQKVTSKWLEACDCQYCVLGKRQE